MSAGLHVEVVGSGPPLVLLHGWAMHGGVFAPLVERLRARCTLHVVDLPGHGHGRSRDSAVPLALESCAAAITAVVPRAPWCGWSLGGLIALHAASTRPDAVPGLAMLCASPRFVRDDNVVAADAPGRDASNRHASNQGAAHQHASRPHASHRGWPYGMSAQIFRDFATGLREDYRGTLDRFIALEAFGSDDARGEVRALRADVFARGEPAAHVLADGLDLLETVDLRGTLPGLRVPSLWIAGRRDRLVDPRAMQAAANLAPHSTFAMIEHGGHAPFLTHADEVTAQLDGFMQHDVMQNDAMHDAKQDDAAHTAST